MSYRNESPTFPFNQLKAMRAIWTDITLGILRVYFVPVGPPTRRRKN
jgi:hypothetical protein